jgi:hypothetical protein
MQAAPHPPGYGNSKLYFAGLLRIAAARAAMGEPRWAAALEAGRTMLLEQAIAEALDEAIFEQRV